MSMNYLRKSRGLPWLKQGMRIEHTHNGRKGRVSGAYGDSVKITLDGDSFSQKYHPTWKMKYFDANGDLVKEYS